jgi:serine/threonine protein kinase
MKIHILPKTGIQESEKYAIERIEREFPKEWQGYASLEIVEKGRLGRELDLVVLTPDRVLIVELKRWHGAIKSEGGYWYLKRPNRDSFDRMETSPVKKNNDKAKILKSILDRNVGGAGSLLVDSRVVLCGNSPSPALTEDEKPYVLQLDEFLKIKDPVAYKRILPLPTAWQNSKWSVNSPLSNIQKFDLLFRGSSHIRARDFSCQNYTIEGKEIFRHPDNLYREYRAINRDDLNSKALLRRWDFSRLGTAASTQNDWVNIAHRESRVYSFVKSKTDELDGVLLQPIGTTASEDVTQDHCELFDLPLKQKRLSEFIETYRGKLPVADRLSLVKVLISKFSELHKLGVAHRDIGDHCVWLERPQSVRLSGFVAAYFPQMETVGVVKEKIAAITTKLPEDFFKDKNANPFHRDVFLLGVVTHLLVFGTAPIQDSELPKWEPNASDPLATKLDRWFEKALSWDTKDRWKDATEMLDALNDIRFSDSERVIPLSAFGYFQSMTKVNQWEELEAPTEKGDAEIFRAKKDGAVCLLKVWYGLKPDTAKPDLNLALLRFLEKAKAIQFTPTEWLPKVIDVGLNNRGLLYAREWLDLPTLLEWLSQDPDQEQRVNLCLNLLHGLERLHAIKIAHGDIHPGNILVRRPGQGKGFAQAVYIDTPDFKNGTDDMATSAYAASNRDRISTEENDRYSVVAVIVDVLGALRENPSTGIFPIPKVYAEVAACLEVQPAILTLAPLVESLENALLPEAPSAESLAIYLNHLAAGIKEGPLMSDNGTYYIERQMIDADQDRLFLIGPGVQLKLVVEVKSRLVKRIDVETLTHQLFQRKISKATPLEGVILIKLSPINDATQLLEAIYQLPEFKDAPQQTVVESQENEDATVTSIDDESPIQRTTIPTRQIWEHLIEAEKDALPELEVRGSPRPHPTREDLILIPYWCATSFEYAPDEEVEVFQETASGTSQKVAVLDHRYSDQNEVALKEARFSLSTAIGAKMVLQSKRDRSSYIRRQEAIQRILSHRSVIPNLVDFFEKDAIPPRSDMHQPPTDQELDAYNIFEGEKRIFSLDEDKREAFKRIYASGPIGLLQGPPGTGKTSFIAAFLHFIINRKGARNVLLVSQSHQATNTALEGVLGLADYMGDSIDVVRVGEDGMLSAPIKHVGVSSLQQSYRETFRAEFKHRVVALSARLGLNQDFVAEYVDLMVHVTRLGEDLVGMAAEIAKIPEGEERRSLETRLASRKEVFLGHVSRVLSGEVPEDVPTIVSRVEEALMAQYRVSNPSAVDRLNLLVRISREWIDVLGSNSGNFAEFLARTRTIVAGTCVGVGRWNLGVAGNIYDWVVIDEAARAGPSELAVAMQVGRRILLVGDHFQLPPLYKDELRAEASRRLAITPESDIFDSDFERAFESPYGRVAGATLCTQYRMAPGICSVVSHCFYKPRGRELKQGRGAASGYYEKLPAAFGTDVIWVDTAAAGREAFEKDAGNPRKKEASNQFEAKVVLDVLHQLLSSDEFIDQLAASVHVGEYPIGIIATYAAQVREIERLLARTEWIGAARSLIKVDTVDSYQGKENKVVILSLVRNNPARRQGFLKSPNRLNVAMSRAMDRLIIVGSSAMWQDRDDGSPLTRVLDQVTTLAGIGKATLISTIELRG